MSLKLHARKRIEAGLASGRARQAAAPLETIDLPPDLAAGDLAGMNRHDFALPDPVTLDGQSLDAEIDDIEALLSEAGLEDPEPPVIEPLNPGPGAAAAEAIIRQLPEGRSQVLLFTSPTDGQGKTTTLARLAPRLAQAMHGSVLVVDANFRNPDMARWLAVAPAWRLPDVLSGTADWAAAVQSTTDPHVSLLPGGTDEQGRSPTIQRMGQLLRELARHYALVLVDGSSLVHREAAQLSAVCDATYLIVRLGDVTPRLLREAAEVIDGNWGRLLGCIAIDSGE
jgi:Mrp family chromosome partitioning ATPase